jgi:hypothetical protein
MPDRSDRLECIEYFCDVDRLTILENGGRCGGDGGLISDSCAYLAGTRNAPCDTCPVIVLTFLTLVTEVMITSPFLLRSKGASPATTAAADADNVVPRDARFEPCRVKPTITSMLLRTRPKSITASKRIIRVGAMKPNSTAAWPDSFAGILASERCGMS